MYLSGLQGILFCVRCDWSTLISFKLIDKDMSISSAKVAFQSGGLAEYDGKAFNYAGIPVEPSAGNLKVVLSVKQNGAKTERNLVWGTDYLITGYERNETAGTAKLIIKGIGDYGGRKMVNFSIQ